MTTLIWSCFGFILGSIPFSVWLGYLVLHKDIRAYGDGNPGAANVLRAGGKAIGIVAIFLDYAKGAVPVAMAAFVGELSGWKMVPVTLAPVFGHAFSPFLAFRGGKAIAASFGVWTGLTLWQGPVLMGLSLGLFYMIQDNDGWSVVLGMTTTLLILMVRHADSYLLAAMLGNVAIVAWKHRRELGRGMHRRPYLRRRTHVDG